MDPLFERALEWEPHAPAPYGLILEQATALIGVILRDWPRSPVETERLLRALHRDLSTHRAALDLRRVERDLAPARTSEFIHGTRRGYKRHQRLGEPACPMCAQADRDFWRAYYAGKSRAPRRAVAECGTLSGYNRHRRLGEQPCEFCRAVKAAYELGRRDRDRPARKRRSVRAD